MTTQNSQPTIVNGLLVARPHVEHIDRLTIELRPHEHAAAWVYEPILRGSHYIVTEVR